MFYYDRASASLLPADQSAVEQSDAKVQIDWRGGRAPPKRRVRDAAEAQVGPSASIRLR
jgi:hypothetical protein